MKYLKLTFALIIILLALPLSWFAAWDSTHSLLALGFSVVLPTWGIMFWSLTNIFSDFFGIGAVSFVLGLAGAWFSQMALIMLLRN